MNRHHMDKFVGGAHIVGDRLDAACLHPSLEHK